MKDKKTVLLGITGGIAAYKMADVASALVKSGCNVRVIMTEMPQIHKSYGIRDAYFKQMPCGYFRP